MLGIFSNIKNIIIGGITAVIGFIMLYFKIKNDNLEEKNDNLQKTVEIEKSNTETLKKKVQSVKKENTFKDKVNKVDDTIDKKVYTDYDNVADKLNNEDEFEIKM